MASHLKRNSRNKNLLRLAKELNFGRVTNLTSFGIRATCSKKLTYSERLRPKKSNHDEFQVNQTYSFGDLVQSVNQTCLVIKIEQLIGGVSALRLLGREVGFHRELPVEVTRDVEVCDGPFDANSSQYISDLQDQLDSAATKSHATGLKLCGALRQFGERVRAGAGGVGGRIARLQYAATRRLADDALARHEAFLRAYRDDQLAILQDQIRLRKYPLALPENPFLNSSQLAWDMLGGTSAPVIEEPRSHCSDEVGHSLCLVFWKANLTITDEECESLLESNNLSIFVDNLQAETQEARRALRDVETRHAELIRVEASLKEVRDLFLQLAHLVSEQQEHVDTVEYYANCAGECVESGGRLLLKGTIARRKARKMRVGERRALFADHTGKAGMRAARLVYDFAQLPRIGRGYFH
ncbi:Syntaxin-1B [Eumeta japonica]|uniref:Syntaxin-1B n=1 Tax=Eumeta variegata TaxID=151549 RepID=A0A4C1VJL7_EUMVA|nr:Syntaxin-1B [Eumeta japonica]